MQLVLYYSAQGVSSEPQPAPASCWCEPKVTLSIVTCTNHESEKLHQEQPSQTTRPQQLSAWPMKNTALLEALASARVESRYRVLTPKCASSGLRWIQWLVAIVTAKPKRRN